ncbi:DUF1798 family protein [Lentibacillus cibarius]|uniref:DUF1798 family protein n=1 Tax=Lentibacillus cibarius TaxID=2583219 RepID=A0A549YKY3_9BACI|nr:DUF1798 family protein [Lentibacillus cibarius]TRM12540.1 DUF1798 family protein [Lentibacillus cibarius]
MELIQETKQFKNYLEVLEEKYNENKPPESKKDRQFFQMVKNYTAPIYDLLTEWENHALQAVKERQVNLHPQQITSTKENMELLMLHSFYIDVKRKRYKELNHSIYFILDRLLDELQK